MALALAWLAKQQNNTGGYWEYDGIAKSNRIAATGMCLLPFLAAGETHKSAKKYKATVAKGLDYLKEQIKQSGEFPRLRQGQYMYAHAIGTVALCEAAGMTKDESLKLVARRAVDYIIKAQAGNGSWGYEAGTEGDTSIVGWQVQARSRAHAWPVFRCPKKRLCRQRTSLKASRAIPGPLTATAAKVRHTRCPPWDFCPSDCVPMQLRARGENDRRFAERHHRPRELETAASARQECLYLLGLPWYYSLAE